VFGHVSRRLPRTTPNPRRRRGVALLSLPRR
jgi:hypothetical protein